MSCGPSFTRNCTEMLPPVLLTSGVTVTLLNPCRLVDPLEIVGAGFHQALAECAVREEPSLLHFHVALQLVVGELLVSNNVNFAYLVARSFDDAKKNGLAVRRGLNIGLHGNVEITLRLKV